MPQWRLVAGWSVPIVLAVVLLVLLVQRGGSEPDAAPRAPAGASPTAAVVTSDDEPPPLPTDPDDPIAAYEAIVAYENWLRHHPDPALVDKIHDPDCPCSKVFKDFLVYLIESGESIARGDVTVDRIEEVSRSGSVVRLDVWVSSPGYDFVSSDGSVAETRAGMSESMRDVTIVFDGTWLLLNHDWVDAS